MAPLLALVWMVVVVVVHVSFSVTIFVDASALARKRGYTTFVSPIIWSLAALMGGVLAVLVYWIIHHSSLNRDRPELGAS